MADVTNHGYYVQYVMQDGGSLCGHCVNSESKLVTFDGRSDAPEDAQWNVIGRQLVDDEPFACDHCGRTYSAV